MTARHNTVAELAGEDVYRCKASSPEVDPLPASHILAEVHGLAPQHRTKHFICVSSARLMASRKASGTPPSDEAPSRVEAQRRWKPSFIFFFLPKRRGHKGSLSGNKLQPKWLRSRGALCYCFVCGNQFVSC